jgi:hypothetical protein
MTTFKHMQEITAYLFLLPVCAGMLYAMGAKLME